MQELHLPPEVHKTCEETQMAIAQAIEERNCLRAEVDLASRRFRKFVYAAHAQALRAERLATEYASASQQVVSSVQGVVQGCSTHAH
jgi:hypothetical protein